MATAPAPSNLAEPAAGQSARASLPPRGWWLYAALWVLLGFALGLADYQDPKWVARRPWEPFFLEMTSVVVIGALAILVYQWVRFIERSAFPLPGQAAAHALGAAAFCLAHVVLTYALRFAGYGSLGLEYQTGTWLGVLAYEAPKDLVTYLFVSGIAWAFRLRQREAAHREQVARARSELAELRLARLADQLQPHFLFNCLNSIAALVEENPKAAVTMIARVGEFLRASLEGQSTTTTLRSELELMRAYLAIQAVRFEDCIRARFDVEPGTEDVVVPRLVLQPLVENAVKHGMVRPESPLVLRIEARRENDGLRILVANSRAPGAAAGAPGTGQGLEHVRRTLELHYGGRARLGIDAGDEWYSVTAMLPAAAGSAQAA